MGMDLRNNQVFKVVSIVIILFMLFSMLWVLPGFAYRTTRTELITNHNLGSGLNSIAPVTTTTTKPTTTTTTKPPTTTTTTLVFATSLKVNAVSGTFGGKVDLSAALTSEGSPVSGKSISFTLNGSSSGNTVTDSNGVATLTAVNLCGFNAGIYSTGVGASFAGDSTYSGSSETAGLTVNPQVLAVTADNQSKVYGDNDPLLTYQVTSGVLVNGDTFSGSLTRTAGESVGTYAIQQGTLTAGSNYTLAFVDGTLGITPQALTVTADNQSKVYGDNDPLLTYQLTSGSLVNGDTFSGSLTRAAGESVGTYAIQQGTLAAGSNYTLTFVDGTFVITPDLTVIISGSGSVNLDNNGPYQIGDIIQLTAIPSVGWVFIGWSGDLSGSNNPAIITMESNKIVTAAFVINSGSAGGYENTGGEEDESGDEAENKSEDPALPEGTTDVRDMITSEGRFTSTLTEISADKLCALTIPNDTVGLDKDLKPLTQISIAPVTTPPTPAAQSVIGLPYDLGPEGTTFDRPVTITFSYDPVKIPAGINEKDLVLAFYDKTAGQWVTLTDIVVDELTCTISGKTSHFTIFSVIANNRPATFVASDLTISPAEAKVGESVNISVDIANTGDLPGSYDVTLKTNTIIAETRQVTLPGHATQKVNFTVNTDVAGSYAFILDNLSGTFIVRGIQAPAATPTPVAISTLVPTTIPAPSLTPAPALTLKPTSTPAPAITPAPVSTPVSTAPPVNWGFIMCLAAMVIVIIGTLTYFLW
jgi:hypothetical protein